MKGNKEKGQRREERQGGEMSEGREVMTTYLLICRCYRADGI